MAYFYTDCVGSRAGVSRLGGKDSGVVARVASYKGGVTAQAYHEDGQDRVRIRFIPWEGRGKDLLLYDGPINPDAITPLKIK